MNDLDLSRREFIKVTSMGTAGFSLMSKMSKEALGAKNGGEVKMNPFDLPFRQIHLDFHTSEHIEGIGSEFDPEEFASTLEKAHVNSVTCFGRGHHGYIYYDTDKFPERRHPHLKRNLLNEQIEACHKRDIRVPIYITIQWDHYTAREHPEWLILDEMGKPIGTPIYEPGFYRFLCVNTPYRDFLKRLLKELFEKVPVDGLFLDIVQVRECSCNYCRAAMVKEKLDPADPEARKKYAYKMINNFKREMTAYIRQFSKDCSIFYNAGHLGPKDRPVADAYTHFELESLPSGGWGYLHFPLTVRYVRNLGRDFMGMTGKFHTSWGDFHSFKNPQALQFECYTMLALGAKCSIGDQLHPNGKIDRATYELVGSVYSEVEKKEPWCKNAKPVTEIGVLSPEESIGSRTPAPSLGVVRMLQEGAHQFDILDSKSDFSGYKVLVLPDVIALDKGLAAKINTFLSKGGALIASYKSGLNEAQDEFALKAWGVKLEGDAPYNPDFILPKGAIGKELPVTEHVMYMKGLEVKALPGSKVLAQTIIPYFNRTYEHFCSHRHTPSSGKVGYPGIVQNGKVIYFMHPIFTQYNQNAPRWCKKLFLNALEILLPDPLIKANGPTTIITTLNEQIQENRWVLHVLNYIPERRGQDFDIIEDVIPLYKIEFSVKVPQKVTKVLWVPRGKSLEFRYKSGQVAFVLPEINGHEMVVLHFV